jgi:hypothetical protein
MIVTSIRSSCYKKKHQEGKCQQQVRVLLTAGEHHAGAADTSLYHAKKSAHRPNRHICRMVL